MNKNDAKKKMCEKPNYRSLRILFRRGWIWNEFEDLDDFRMFFEEYEGARRVFWKG